MTPASSVAPRVDARNAADTITNERCKAAERCGEVGRNGSKYASFDHCRNVIQSETYRSFSENPDCSNGVPDADLRRCRTEIANEDCGGFSGAIDSVDRYMSCRSGHLCME